MYFPYFRGRQYELLALRELAQGDLLGGRVIPVVEPIKLTPTFSGTVRLFADKKQPLALILNPAVGELASGAAVGAATAADADGSLAGAAADATAGVAATVGAAAGSAASAAIGAAAGAVDTAGLAAAGATAGAATGAAAAAGSPAAGSAAGAVLPFISGSVIPAVIMGEGAAGAMAALSAKNMPAGGALALMDSRDFLGQYRSLFGGEPPRFTLFPRGERAIRRAVGENRAMFEDKFRKREKNADYLKREDEFYSDDHLYFSEEGFVGFGDYSIVGDEYDESGFAPRAVAIHIVYFADGGSAENTLRVRHFVSDTNDDISDVAGKFHEAAMKLKRWHEAAGRDAAGRARQPTAAMRALLGYAEDGYYPGLPTVKKLSIMHHLELVGKYLGARGGGIDGGMGG